MVAGVVPVGRLMVRPSLDPAGSCEPSISINGVVNVGPPLVGWVVPSMRIELVIVGKAPDVRVIFWTPTPLILKSIESPPAVAFAAMIAARNEPAPLSLVVVTNWVSRRRSSSGSTRTRDADLRRSRKAEGSRPNGRRRMSVASEERSRPIRETRGGSTIRGWACQSGGPAKTGLTVAESTRALAIVKKQHDQLIAWMQYGPPRKAAIRIGGLTPGRRGNYDEQA